MIAVALSILPVRLEAETGKLFGPRIVATRPGFSGTGYVTDVVADKARIVWDVRAKGGIYEASVRFATSGGEKGFDFSANGFRSSGMLPATNNAWATQSIGRVELRSGDNKIAIERGWGYYDVDYVELTPAKKPKQLLPVPIRLSDREASLDTRALYSKLLKSYGSKTFSGQYDEKECAFVEERTGKVPALLGGDLMDYSPSRLPFLGQNGEKMPVDFVPGWIAAAKRGQILTLSWHWNAPTHLINTMEGDKNRLWYRGFYTDATTFDVQKALADPKSEEYRLILRDIDAAAVQLKRLAVAHVPVLWRPLHEAEGGWFWWGAKGPDACKGLYRLMFNRLTKHHGLHNLIWVWNSAKDDWYPGDDVVDVMSVDQYPSDRRDALSPVWEDLLKRFDGRKPLALAEFPGAPDVERMRRFGVRWLFFVSWTGDVGPKSTPAEILRRTYRLKSVINVK